ncbi:hypothetical protein BC938DRAFT_482537, partial [Jimgerdemannia flammicorona]
LTGSLTTVRHLNPALHLALLPTEAAELIDLAQTVADKKKKGCIYSVHVHPDGARLATGGLGSSHVSRTGTMPLLRVAHTKVKIWNTAPLFDPSKENDDSILRLLCTMTMHNG